MEPDNPHQPPTNKGLTFPVEILTAAEARALVHAPSGRAPTGIRNRALIAVMYGGGLRLAEALALKPSDVDPDGGTVRVLHGKNDRPRTAAIRDGALGHVARWIDRRRELKIRGRILFCKLDGEELNPRYVRAMVSRAATRAGIEKRVHPHGLRHCYAVELERAGVPVATIQQMLGHAHLNTTAIYLSGISPTDRIAAVRNLEPVL
jgi:site-specific recombinase XerD